MTLSRLTVAVLVVTASASRAEPPEDESSRLAPTWSLGAGLSFGPGGSFGLGGLASLGPSGGLGGLGVLTLANASVTPNVSLERVFSSRFALGLGLEGGVNTSSTVGATRPNPASGSIAIGVSPRFTLTSQSAPVAFTVLATVFTGFASGGGVLISTPLQEFTFSAQTLSVGAMGGIALEKRFFERFAVRIQAQLARVTFSRNWSSSPTQDLTTGAVTDNRNVSSFVNASFVPSPSIELRLYL